MLAKQLMSQPVSVCQPGDSLSQAAQLMWDADCGVVPIVDSAGRVIAMLTDRDICMAAYTQGKPLGEIPVRAAMSKGLYKCGPDDTLEQVEALMVQYQIRRLPVVDQEGRPIGILSLNDLARTAEKQLSALPAGSSNGQLLTARILAAVCAHRMNEPGPRLT